MSLRTNYKDDVFSGSRKYSMTTNPDTTVSFTDETQYTQQGDTYGAAQINEQNDHINNLDSHSFLDNATAETSLADGDYLPFYDTSANAKRRVLLSKLKDFLLGALAPKVHDSNSAGTYGAATASKFGHVKLSNSYTSSDGAANNSVGASSQAVYDAYRNRAPINHASNATTYGRGSDSLYGHVMLSDAYESNAGAASAGMAASGKAVYDSYANLNGKINTANSNISGLSTRMGTAEGNITSVTNRTTALESRASTLENELTANNKRIYMDYKNGKYGYNTSANRGADTFHPFSVYDFAFARVGAYGRLVDLVNGTCNYMGDSCTMRGITFRSTTTPVPDMQTTYTITFYAPTNNCDLISTNSATLQSGEVALAVKHCTSTNDYIQFVSNHTNVGAIVFVKLY